ncbi:hypothetical protein O0L34_g2293 [Tuta absoluta]|nr:hypothetical protein O0L34_g2293 [Tuta absoluta]
MAAPYIISSTHHPPLVSGLGWSPAAVFWLSRPKCSNCGCSLHYQQHSPSTLVTRSWLVSVSHLLALQVQMQQLWLLLTLSAALTIRPGNQVWAGFRQLSPGSPGPDADSCGCEGCCQGHGSYHRLHPSCPSSRSVRYYCDKRTKVTV